MFLKQAHISNNAYSITQIQYKQPISNSFNWVKNKWDIVPAGNSSFMFLSTNVNQLKYYSIIVYFYYFLCCHVRDYLVVLSIKET